jgi:hypothetical protein
MPWYDSQDIPTKRERNWFFTLNNYTEDDCDVVKQLATQCQYAVVGREVSRTGTPHLQGCIWLKHAKTYTALMKLLPRMWLRKLISDKAAAYCAKDNDLVVNKPPPPVRQGRRTDIIEALRMRDEGVPMEEIVSTVSYQAARHIELVMRRVQCMV